MLTKSDLIEFEQEVANAFTAKKVNGPIHLSGGNEDQLIEIFKEIKRTDWVFSTYRSHYHALLHGVPRDWLMQQILDGHSMNIMSPEHRFFSSAIVGGCLPIAVGMARGGQRTWCFVGDMAATTGAFHEALQYVGGLSLNCIFVVEDNGMSCDTPTYKCWHDGMEPYQHGRKISYHYTRKWPHSGVGKYVF